MQKHLGTDILHVLGGSLPHDEGGRLLAMGREASDLFVQAQSFSQGDPRKQELLLQAKRLRMQEKEGWLAVSTQDFPAGDVEGAAKASLAIATYHFELQEIAIGKQWLQQALDEAPADNVFLRAMIMYNFSVVGNFEDCLDAMSLTSTQAASGSASGRSSPEHTDGVNAV